MSDVVSALAGARSDARAIVIEDTGLRGMITLRGDLGSTVLARAVADVTGTALPATLTAVFDGDKGAVWMSPDELLLFVPYDQAGVAVAALGAALDGTHHLAVNVSDARTVLRLSDGPVADVLGKSIPVDLSEAAFPVGTARRTHLGQTAIGLWRRSDGWEIVCFRSLAHHLFDWLAVSADPAGLVGFYSEPTG